jgi:tetratricopeptide (TPR) repeat protein
MRMRALLWTVAVVGLGALTLVALDRHRAGEAAHHLAEARERLDASLLEAPELVGIEASGALAHLDRALAAGASEARVRGLREYARALVKLQTRDLLAATRALEAARRELGMTADLHVVAGTIARLSLDRDEARLQVDAALRIDPRHPRALLLDADLALDRHDGAAALRALDALVEEVPDSSAVHNREGLAHERLGQIAAAEAAFREAIRLHRRNPDAWINLGRVLAQEGELDGSRRAYDTAIALAPSAADAHLGRGLTRLAAGLLDAAADDLERAAELSPDDDAPLLALGDVARARGELDEAVARYREGLRKDATDGHGWVKLGNALFATADVPGALAAYDRALAEDPALAAAHNGRGAALMRLGRVDDAASALERAASLDVVDPNPLLNLGLLHESAGDRRAAARAFERALERDPGSTVARARLSSL